MLVDDNEIDAELLGLCLAESRLGNELVTFDRATAFLDHLDAVATGRADMPAVVLVDVDMPRVNGFELVEQVLARRDLPTPLRLVLFTSSDDPVDIERARRLGLTYQTKPAHADGFIDFLNELAIDVT